MRWRGHWPMGSTCYRYLVSHLPSPYSLSISWPPSLSRFWHYLVDVSSPTRRWPWSRIRAWCEQRQWMVVPFILGCQVDPSVGVKFGHATYSFPKISVVRLFQLWPNIYKKILIFIVHDYYYWIDPWIWFLLCIIILFRYTNFASIFYNPNQA